MLSNANEVEATWSASTSGVTPQQAGGVVHHLIVTANGH
jgi:hypothetical protein